MTGWDTLVKGSSLVMVRVPVWPALASHFSRINLAGSEPALVQVALGQAVRLFCPEDASMDPHTRWQKDGQPVSSDRCVQGSSPSSSTADSPWVEGECEAMGPSGWSTGAQGGWAHCPQEPRTKPPSPLAQAQAAA